MAQHFRFGECVVDTDRFEFRRGREPVRVQPKVLSLLLFLLEHRDRTVTQDEILDALWPGSATGEGSLTRAVSVARAALGGDPIGVPVAVEGGDPPVAARRADPKASCLRRDK